MHRGALAQRALCASSTFESLAPRRRRQAQGLLDRRTPLAAWRCAHVCAHQAYVAPHKTEVQRRDAQRPFSDGGFVHISGLEQGIWKIDPELIMCSRVEISTCPGSTLCWRPPAAATISSRSRLRTNERTTASLGFRFVRRRVFRKNPPESKSGFVLANREPWNINLHNLCNGLKMSS